MIVISKKPSFSCLGFLCASFHAYRRSKDFRLRSGFANRFATETLFQKRLRHSALQNFRLSDSVENHLKQTTHLTSLNFHFIAITKSTCRICHKDMPFNATLQACEFSAVGRRRSAGSGRSPAVWNGS
jgi:hypothetical protein